MKKLLENREKDYRLFPISAGMIEEKQLIEHG
jgi:hypothetical protein